MMAVKKNAGNQTGDERDDSGGETAPCKIGKGGVWCGKQRLWERWKKNWERKEDVTK
jgi:hypothetical protein